MLFVLFESENFFFHLLDQVCIFAFHTKININDAIFNLVLLEPGKSFVRVIQSIGRGVRKAADKDHVEIWDVASTAKYSKKHLTERKKFYAEANYPYTIEKVNYK